jgi:4-hydroxy-2-oxoheptanedioate aldolase
MIRNKLNEIWAEGRPVLHGWLSISNPFVAEIMAEQGYDAISIDLQHGVHDYMGAVSMFQAMRASGVVPMARVPWLDAGWIMKVLDAGAYGIICPMISTPEQAAELASYCRYPPRGQRSFGPTRAVYHAGANYAAEANDEVLVFAMIETAEGVKNARAICETPGIDGIYIGPADLTLGVTSGALPAKLDREEPEMIEVIREVLGHARAAGIHACLHCGTADYAARAVGWGFDMVTVSGDARLLAAAAGDSIRRFRDLTGTEGAAPGVKPAY